MERYLELTINNSNLQTVGEILRGPFGLTKKEISQAKFRKDGIQKNGKQCRVTERVKAGDVIRVCLETKHSKIEKVSPSEKNHGNLLHILYEDQDLLAVNKPAGLVTHPSGIHEQDTLSNLIAAYFQEKGESTRIRSIGRLDKETSGILLFAKNQVAAARLQKQRETGIFQKTYLEVASGIFDSTRTGKLMDKGKKMALAAREDQAVYKLEIPLAPDPENPLKMKASFDGTLPSSKDAVTWFSVLKKCGENSLLQVWLGTGRTHQIRVHMASIGHPLLGDTLYNSKCQRDGLERAALHAWKLCLVHPFTKEKMVLEAPLPEDFEKMVNVKKWNH